MKTYAYVTSETCCVTKAERPGAEVDHKPVARHGDYNRWGWGKRETMAMIENESGYRRRAARAVAWLLGWSDER